MSPPKGSVLFFARRAHLTAQALTDGRRAPPRILVYLAVDHGALVEST